MGISCLADTCILRSLDCAYRIHSNCFPRLGSQTVLQFTCEMHKTVKLGPQNMCLLKAYRMCTSNYNHENVLITTVQAHDGQPNGAPALWIVLPQQG